MHFTVKALKDQARSSNKSQKSFIDNDETAARTRKHIIRPSPLGGLAECIDFEEIEQIAKRSPERTSWYVKSDNTARTQKQCILRGLRL